MNIGDRAGVSGTHKDYFSFQCNECHISFADNRDFTTHKNTHIEVRSFICEDCGLQTTTESDMTEHRKTHIEAESSRNEVNDTECRNISLLQVIS